MLEAVDTCTLTEALEALGGISYETFRRKRATGALPALKVFRLGRETRVIKASIADQIKLSCTEYRDKYR